MNPSQFADFAMALWASGAYVVAFLHGAAMMLLLWSVRGKVRNANR